VDKLRAWLLAERKLPPPATVRVSELIDLDGYCNDQIAADQAIGLTVDFVECPWNKRHGLLQVRVRGGEAETQLQLELNPQRVQLCRAIDQESAPIATTRQGCLTPGKAMTALFEIVPRPAADSDRWVTVQVVCNFTGAPHLTQLTERVTASPLSLARARPEARFTAAVAAFGLLLQGQGGDMTFAGVRNLAAGAVGSNRGSKQAELLKLMDAAIDLAKGR
jgi:hypothetical protein